MENIKKMSRDVLTNGVFDILHPGHFNLLVKCRELAGRFGKVFVAIDSDEKVKKDKGASRPYFSERERANNLLSLKYPLDGITIRLIDEIYVFKTNQDLYEVIDKLYMPDIIVKGSDWKGNVVGSDLAEVIYFDRQDSLSTTNIEERIREKLWKEIESDRDPVYD